MPKPHEGQHDQICKSYLKQGSLQKLKSQMLTLRAHHRCRRR